MKNTYQPQMFSISNKILWQYRTHNVCRTKCIVKLYVSNAVWLTPRRESSFEIMEDIQAHMTQGLYADIVWCYLTLTSNQSNRSKDNLTRDEWFHQDAKCNGKPLTHYVYIDKQHRSHCRKDLQKNVHKLLGLKHNRQHILFFDLSYP